MEERTAIVFTTIDKETEAVRIARHLVEHRLAACVNIIPGLRSFYVWKDQIQDEAEFLLLIKTSHGALLELEETLKSIHTYELPEIVAVDIARCEERFRDWILRSMGRDPRTGEKPGAAGTRPKE